MMVSPIGVNNLNQLVEQQLGNTGYEVVRAIYNNIQWLYSIHQQLPKLQTIQQATAHLDVLVKNTHTLQTVVQHLNSIESLNSNLPLVQDLAPRLDAFKASLDKYQTALKENNQKVTVLEDLYLNSDVKLRNLELNTKNLLKRLVAEAKKEIQDELKTGLCEMRKLHKTATEQHTELMANADMLKSYLKTAKENQQMLKHLMASDAVNTYLWEQNEAYKKQALNAIRESERVGNSEVTNRHKMKSNKTDLNLFKVLNRNNLELANKAISKG